MGLLLAETRFDDVRSFPCLLEDESAEKLPGILDEMRAKGIAQLRAEGFEGTPACLAAVDMRYAKESYEITIAVNQQGFDRSELTRHFDQEHHKLYGFSHSGTPHEIISVRTTVIGDTPYPDLLFEVAAGLQAGVRKPLPVAMTRRIFEDADRAFVDMPVHPRDSLSIDLRLRGPAVIEEMDSTTYIPSGWEAGVDGWANLILRSITD
jgi:N-methylhydantoinase A